MVLSNYNARNIHFSLKEYSNNYQSLLTDFLSIHEDFDEKQFIDYELDLYDLCLENATLTHYFHNGKNKYAVNFGNCRFIISKIYDNLVNFKDENDGWDLELALKYQATFKKVIDYLKRKKEVLLDINSTRYNNLLNIAKTPEVKELLTNIFYKNFTLFSVVNFIKEKTNNENYDLFISEFNNCYEMISNEFMYEVNVVDIKQALDIYSNNLEYVYVNDGEIDKINQFIRTINNIVTVFNVRGLSKTEEENTTKLVLLNNLMIDYYNGFFAKEIKGFENISQLKHVYYYLNNIERKSNQIENIKLNEKEPSNYKNKKIADKWYALLYLIEVEVYNKKIPTNLDGAFIKSKIEEIGKQKCKNSGQGFYRHVLDLKDNLNNNVSIKRLFNDNWKTVIIELSNNDENIIKYLDINYK